VEDSSRLKLFKSVDETLVCDHSKETELLHSTFIFWKSVFACIHRTHVVGIVRQLVHTKRIEAYKRDVVYSLVCKTSAHDATLKIAVILSLHHGCITDLNLLSFVQPVVGTKV